MPKTKELKNIIQKPKLIKEEMKYQKK